MPELRSIGKFEYRTPDSLPGALEILDAEKDACKVLAGGTDLILQMKQRLVLPSVVLDVKQVPELNRLEWNEKEGLCIGAAVPLSRLLALTGLPKAFHILFQACSLIGSTQIKNRGSIGGNICNAAPSADSAPALLCLDAEVRVASRKGERGIPLEEFFLGPGKTVLSEDELLVEIRIPTPPASSAGYYLRHTTREEMDISVAGVAAFLTLSPRSGQVQAVRIALGAVAPTPTRAPGAEAFLEGRTITRAVIEQAAETAAGEAEPISDLRSSSAFRRELVKVLTRRTLKKDGEELGLSI